MDYCGLAALAASGGLVRCAASDSIAGVQSEVSTAISATRLQFPFSIASSELRRFRSVLKTPSCSAPGAFLNFMSGSSEGRQHGNGFCGRATSTCGAPAHCSISMRSGGHKDYIFNALRGLLTAERVGVSGITLGDPGILAGRLIRRPKKETAVAAIPHFLDKRRLPDLPRHWRFVDPEQPVDDVLTQIASAELVVSSSLHGLIAADSFGIPCVWTAFLGGQPDSPTHKFLDHASARGRDFNAPMTWVEAVAMPTDMLASAWDEFSGSLCSLIPNVHEFSRIMPARVIGHMAPRRSTRWTTQMLR